MILFVSQRFTNVPKQLNILEYGLKGEITVQKKMGFICDVFMLL